MSIVSPTRRKSQRLSPGPIRLSLVNRASVFSNHKAYRALRKTTRYTSRADPDGKRSERSGLTINADSYPAYGRRLVNISVEADKVD